MSKFFDPENGFFTFINKAIDTLWVGALWCIISFAPVLAAFFTENKIILIIGLIISCFLLGPASTALYYATVKVTRRSRSYITKEFFRSLKLNFVVGGIASCIYGLFAYVLWIDFQYANSMIDEGNSIGNVMFVAFVAGSCFLLVSLAWIFPILSRYSVNLFGLFRNALLIATKHLVRTILLLLLWGVIGVLCYVFQNYLLALIFLVPIIPGIVALARSFIIEPILKKYAGESAGDPEETGIDEWYRE